MQRVALRFIFFIMIMGCASKYNLEPNTIINTKESYYTEWSSPVRDGGSGYSTYIVLDEKLDLNTKQIEIQGIYFQDKYSALKYQKPRFYQGFIKKKASTNTFEMEEGMSPPSDKEAVNEDIPFKLTDQEAVIVYKVKNALKYIKIGLHKKETLVFPMYNNNSF